MSINWVHTNDNYYDDYSTDDNYVDCYNHDYNHDYNCAVDLWKKKLCRKKVDA